MSADRSWPQPRGWLTALLATAVGLYFSRGLLDIVGGSNGVVPVAMLPPWWELAAFLVVLGGLGVWQMRAGRDADIVVPLCALCLLALPFVPWLPDSVPVLRALAGPGRDLLWIVVFWLVACGALCAMRPLTHTSRMPLAVFLASVLIIGSVAWHLAGGSQFPGGDEPHYLVITQSLLNDGDLKIENNHQREDYRAYFTRPLKPDYLTRGKDGQIYSIHPIGLPVIAAPAFAIGGYRGVVAMLVLMAALASTLLWQLARASSGSASAATFAWASVALTAPFLFNAITVYPEIPGALAVLVALAWRPDVNTHATLHLRGLALGALPWLSTKYAPMAAVAALVVGSRVSWKPGALAALVLPIAVSFGGWFAFFYWIWGTFSPSAPYGSSEPTTLAFLARGGPGLFFDQEYGVVAYAPVIALAIVGLTRMLRAGGADARRAVEVIAVLGALVVTVGAFRLWWGGTASPGRPLASGILLLGVPIAAAFKSAESRPAARAACHVLLATSLAVAFVLAVTQDGALLRNDRDGASTFIGWLSPTWPLTSAFPSFIAGSYASAAARTLAWLALGFAATFVARLVSPTRFGRAALTTIAVGVVGAVALASLTRPATEAAIDPEARPRAPLLDEFDAHRRPIAIVYDLVSFVSPADILRRVVLTARPGQHTAPQPLELLWNARFSLPAGEYRLHVTRSGELPAADIGLQIGRVGPPIDRWRFEGNDFERRLLLPIDAALVGLRTTSPDAPLNGTLQIEPVRIVDASRRIDRPQVISAAHYGSRTVFFHDETTTAERSGYWTQGRATTTVTYALAAASPALDIEVRCGPIANRVTFSTRGWKEDVTVEPGGAAHVSVPTTLQPDLGVRIAPLDISVRDGFVPAEIDHTSTDRRLLGCWIEMGRDE